MTHTLLKICLALNSYKISRTNVYLKKHIWYNIDMEKEIFNINKNQLSYGRGYVYSLVSFGLVRNTGRKY